MRSDNRLVNDFISASLSIRHLFVAGWMMVDAAVQEFKTEGHFLISVHFFKSIFLAICAAIAPVL